MPYAHTAQRSFLPTRESPPVLRPTFFIIEQRMSVMVIMVLTFVVLQWSQEHDAGGDLGLRHSCHRTMGSFGDQLGCGGCVGSWSSVSV